MAVAIVSLVCVVIALAMSSPVRIAWHRWRMQKARELIWSNAPILESPVADMDQSKVIEEYERRREELVRLGALVEKRYLLQSIKRSSAEATHFLAAADSGAAPPFHDWVSEWGGPQDTAVVPLDLTVWCWSHGDIEAWDEYIAARDVPDYRERFMGESK